MTESLPKTQLFTHFYRVNSVLLDLHKTQFISTLNLLDQNYYIIKKIQLPSSGVNDTVLGETEAILDFSMGDSHPLSRSVRYYNSWLETDFVAEEQPPQPTEAPPQPSSKKKTTILGFINKDKKERKQAAIARRESQRVSISRQPPKIKSLFLYMQFESFSLLNTPKPDDAMNLLCLVYLLNSYFLSKGVYVSLDKHSIVRDNDKKIKFMNKARPYNYQTNCDQLVKLYLQWITGVEDPLTNKAQAISTQRLTEAIKLRLSEERFSEMHVEIVQELDRNIQQSVQASVSVCGKESLCRLSLSGFMQLRIQQIDHQPDSPSTIGDFELDLDECTVEYFKQLGKVYITIKHIILEPIQIKFAKGPFLGKFLKELSR